MRRVNPALIIHFLMYMQILLRYKPWQTTQNNAWDDQEPIEEILINCWHEFLQTPYGQSNVPDWFDKLQAVIQSEEQEDEPSEEREVTREEWMILEDLNTPFDRSEQTPDPSHDWHLDRTDHSPAVCIRNFLFKLIPYIHFYLPLLKIAPTTVTQLCTVQICFLTLAPLLASFFTATTYKF